MKKHGSMIEKVIQLLADIKKEDSSEIGEININSDIVNDVGLDSLQMINFILSVEDEFSVQIDFAKFDFSYLSSVGAFCDFVASCKENCTTCG